MSRHVATWAQGNFIHMSGVDGCNFGIVGVYTSGNFPKELENIERMFIEPIVEQAGWSVRNENGSRTDHVITRRIDDVEGDETCRTTSMSPDRALSFPPHGGPQKSALTEPANTLPTSTRPTASERATLECTTGTTPAPRKRRTSSSPK